MLRAERRLLVVVVIIGGIILASCAHDMCPPNDLSAYLNQYDKSINDFLFTFNRYLFQASIDKQPSLIILMLSDYSDFKALQPPDCALENQKQTLDAMQSIIDAAMKIGGTNASKLSNDQLEMINQALSKMQAANTSATQLRRFLQTDTLPEEYPIATVIAGIPMTETALASFSPTSAPQISNTPSSLSGMVIGNISFQLPSTGTGWCLTGKHNDTDRESYDLSSQCQPTNDPKATIEIQYLYSNQASSTDAINSFIQALQNNGFTLANFQFMQEPYNSSVGSVQFATGDITSNQNNNPAFIMVGSFSANEDWYIIRGLSGETKDDYTYLFDSIISIIDSILETR